MYMGRVKKSWANFKKTPYWFQIVLWCFVGGAIVEVLQDCGVTK